MVIVTVIPKSGCNNNNTTKVKYIKVVVVKAGKCSCSYFFESIHATITVKKGFINSEGCILKPPKLIQRVAPFTSVPTNKTATISKMPVAKPVAPSNLMFLGENVEMTKRVTSATLKYTICFLMKKNDSKPILSATAGLAVATIKALNAIIIRIITKENLSTDHHHCPMKVFLI